MKFLVKNMRADAPVTTGNDQTIDTNEISESQITSEMELLKSRDLLKEVVKQTNLARFEAKGREVTDVDTEQAVYRLEKELVLAPVKKANIIEVSYSSTSPETAAFVLNKLSELYLEKHLRLHRPPGTSDFFKNQAGQYQNDLRDAENKFSNFQQQKDAVDIDQQKELTLTKLTDTSAKLKDLDGKIGEGEKRIAALEKQLAGMDRRVTTQSRVLPNQYSVERLNTMLVELRNKRIQLLTKFQPDDRVVRETDDQIKETAEALSKAVGSTAVEQASDINPLRQPLETELANVKVDQAGNVVLRKNLQEQVKGYQDKLASLAGATPIHNDLSRQVKQAEQTYELYSKKQEESQIEDALDEKKITNISVAEAPIVPLTPNKTNLMLVIVIGLSSGLMLAFGSAFVTELLRETFLTPRELQLFTGHPVLATIPIERKKNRRADFVISEQFFEADEDEPQSPHEQSDERYTVDASHIENMMPPRVQTYRTQPAERVEFHEAVPVAPIDVDEIEPADVQHVENVDGQRIEWA
jgi:uncharacterized protein involved in exopolysaccharide biosynthesis